MILLSALMVSACVSNQPRTEAPDWASVKQIQNNAEDLEPLPVLCEIPIAVDDAGCWATFEVYEEISDANYKIGMKNTSALRKTEGAHNHLANAGKIQQELSDFYKELLAEERQEHLIDNLTFRVIIGLGLIGAAL